MERSNEIVLTSLLNSLWLLPVIWSIAALSTVLLRNAAAHQRYVVWIGALALCIVAPLLSSIQFPLNLTATKASIVDTTIPNTYAIDDGDSPLNHLQKRDWQVVTTKASTVRPFIVGYGLFLLLGVARFARLWWRKEQLHRSTVPLEATLPLEDTIERCHNVFDVRHVQVARSSSARVPCTLGFQQPLIVLPDRFCTGISDEILLSILAHEMAHVSRRDYLVKLLVELLSIPISFHPITFLIKRSIERERELACDELVTTKLLSTDTYARSLLFAADLSVLPVPKAAALSIFDGRILEKRIMRLKKGQPRTNRVAGRLLASAVLLVMCALAVSLSVFGVELRSDVAGKFSPAPLTRVVSTLPTFAKTTTQQQAEKRVSPTAGANERAQTACAAEHKRDLVAIPTLVAMLGDDSQTQLLRCWEGSRWSPALDTFKSPSPGEQAALALASMGQPAFRPLTEQLDNSNAVVRRNAAWAIGELTNMLPHERSSAVPQLITLLSDRDVWARMAAARALGELRDRRATPTLVAGLADSDWRMREITTWALSELKDDQAVNALCAALLSDSRVEVRRGAAEALGEIASEVALASLKQALNDPEPSVSAKVRWAIDEIEG